MIDLNRLAEMKADQQFMAEDWFAVLNSLSIQLVFDNYTDGEILRVINAASTPDCLLQFLSFLQRNAPTAPGGLLDQLMEAVEQSNFDLSQWMDALVAILYWKGKKDNKVSFDLILKYINECGQIYTGGPVSGDLKKAVEKSLNEKGFCS